MILSECLTLFTIPKFFFYVCIVKCGNIYGVINASQMLYAMVALSTGISYWLKLLAIKRFTMAIPISMLEFELTVYCGTQLK